MSRDVEVRAATRIDVGVLGRALGRAFSDDPIWTWVYRQGDRAPRLARMFAALTRATLDREATVLTDTETRGAAIWQRSQARSLGVLGNLRMGAAMVRSGASMSRSTRLMREMERRHPKEPHWYLAVLGTDPDRQGSGVGSALVRHLLDDPANAGQAAYLETETAGNVSYYLRFGFEVIDELDVGDDGPHMWLMWRDPPGGA